MKYRISRSAARDLFEIGRYTVREWGENQADIYLSALETRFQWLASNKPLWRKRPDIQENLSSYQHDRHIIICTERGECLRIVRVLHERMDVAGRIGE